MLLREHIASLASSKIEAWINLIDALGFLNEDRYQASQRTLMWLCEELQLRDGL
jgi:hypothetical protein